VQFPKYNPEAATYDGSQVWRKFIAAGLVAVAFSPDGKLFAAAQGGETDKGQAHLIETETGKLVRELGSHQYGMTDVMFSPDGKYLITAGRDTAVRVSQVEDGKEVLVLGAPRGGQFKDWISAIALSPDQTRIAAADIAGTIAVWRVE
jgi:WD40 repeat protein